MTDDKLSAGASDAIVVITKGALGAVPFVGSLLAELAGAAIPNQRIDRVVKFAVALESRLSIAERELFAQCAQREVGADLLEEAMRQAASSLSDVRRQYIASLVATCLSDEAIKEVEAKHLLKVLGELNDAEVIWLRSYSNAEFGGDKEFRDRHSALLRVGPVHMQSPQSDLDRSTLSVSYSQHLGRLGLLNELYDIDSKTQALKVTREGRLAVKRYSLSDLGRLLLRSIGLADI